MSPLRVLIIQPGTTAPGVRRQFGDYDAWFKRALASEPVEWEVVRVDRGEPLPEPRAFDAVIITGSPASVTSHEPYIEEAATWTRRTVESGTPLLGVCFGHQLLGYAFGGDVAPNPLGFEFGTATVHLTPEGETDPLFAGLPRPLRFQETHEDMLVDPPPPGIRVLARNDHCAVQAIAVGERARGVQFHPETTDEVLRSLSEEVGLPVPEALPTPAGPMLLSGFLRSFVRTRRA